MTDDLFYFVFWFRFFVDLDWWWSLWFAVWELVLIVRVVLLQELGIEVVVHLGFLWKIECVDVFVGVVCDGVRSDELG